MIIKAKDPYLDEIFKINSELKRDIPKYRWTTRKWIRKQIEKGNYYVFKDNHKIIGAICLVPEKNELYIETIAILSNYQGQGIGKELIDFAKQKAIGLKKPKLTVESFVSFRLDKFYKKMGFSLDEPAIDYYEDVPYYRFFYLPFSSHKTSSGAALKMEE